MKKIIGITLLFSLVIIACHKKTVPTVTTRTEQPPAPVKKEVVPAINTTTASVADLEAGKLIYETKCAKCHAPKPVEHWTVDGWKPILKSMIRKSKLDSIETAQVTAWVNANAKKI